MYDSLNRLFREKVAHLPYNAATNVFTEELFKKNKNDYPFPGVTRKILGILEEQTALINGEQGIIFKTIPMWEPYRSNPANNIWHADSTPLFRNRKLGR